MLVSRPIKYRTFIFCWIILLGCLSHLAQAASSGYTELLLNVIIGEQDTQEVVSFLQQSNGELLISRTSLEHWHFHLPPIAPVIYQDSTYYPLKSFSGLTYELDMAKLSVKLHVPPALLMTSEFTMGAGATATPPAQPGAFFNYDLNSQRATTQTQIGGLFEAGYFNSLGVGTTNFVVQRGSTQQTTRLNTTWTVDDPVKMRSVRFGDSYSAPGMWGRSIGFGGVQWGRNFSTQPGLITFPLPNVRGEAVTPSIVDLYVNNALLSHQEVPLGPFNVKSVPVVSGQGILNIVTTDLLGRQQSVSIPYYASNDLLRPGLHNFSYEAGFIRENLGVVSNDYGRAVLVGTDRVGLTDNLTGEWHTELLRDQQTLGMGGSYLLLNRGVVSTAVAVSRKVGQGSGALLFAGIQRQTTQGVNFGLTAQTTTRNFSQLGLQTGQLAPSLLTQAFVGIPLWDNNSIGVSYTRQINRGSLASSFINASYSKSLGKYWSCSISTLSNVGGENNKAAFLTLSRAIGDRSNVSIGSSSTVSASQPGVANQGNFQIQHNLPIGNGIGYNLYATNGSGGQQTQQGSFSAQNEFGTYTATAAREANQTGYRFEAEGSIATLGGGVYFARSIGDSFGVVQVPGYSGVDIYENNQLIGHTDSKGNILIPNLLPYQVNPVRVDPSKIPLDAKVEATSLNAVPYYRSGVLMRFPIKPAHAATLRLLQTFNEPVPAGATISVVGQEEQFPVAEDGVVYVTGLTEKSQLVGSWDDKSCSVTIDYPKTSDPLPDLGTYICENGTK